MARARRISRLQLAVLLVIALFGCALLAFAPRGQHNTSALAAKVRLELPDVSVTETSRLLQSDEIIVSTPSFGRSDATRPLARLRPVSAQRIKVAMYDEARGEYADETIMSLESTISRIGLEAYQR